MDGFLRWAPFAGTIVTVLCAFAKALGFGEEADAVLRVIALFLPGIESADATLATTAATSVVGLVRQLRSRYLKAKAPAAA